MLDYDEVREEFFYLYVLSLYYKNDYIQQAINFDTPDEFQNLINEILNKGFSFDNEKTQRARVYLKKQFHYKTIDKEKFDCFKGSDRGSWFALMYIYNNSIIPEPSSNVFTQDNVFVLNSIFTPLSEFKNIDEIKNFSLDEMQMDIPPDKKEKNRGLSEKYLREFYLTAGADPDEHSPNTTSEQERICTLMRFIDFAPVSLNQKISYFRKLHDKWLDQYNKFLSDYDWLDKKDEKQAIYCWEYLRNKNMIPPYLKPYNTAMRIQMIIACLDSWDIEHVEKYLFIQKMKHAWQQAVSSRKKQKNKQVK
ncbi:hypothetical protein [Kluyvera intermedia]|uniref:hypothetical protein n=1 Tax=Kluyvera intermedia TaxID=61648 RepID=UPI0039F5DC48